MDQAPTSPSKEQDKGNLFSQPIPTRDASGGFLAMHSKPFTTSGPNPDLFDKKEEKKPKEVESRSLFAAPRKPEMPSSTTPSSSLFGIPKNPND